ncbi:MAG: cellulose biosynthesis protein CelD, partial [Fidelibacterota bacterium]
MGFRVEVVRNWNRFYTLRTDWDVLLTSSRADTVFLTWEWVSSWSMIVRNAVKPFVIVVRDNNNRLVGLAPFYLTALVLLKTVKYRTLRIMADVNTGSEYPGWIVTRESEIEILRLIARTLNQYR